MTEDLSALPALVRFLPGFIKRRIAKRPNLVKILDNIGWLFFDKILRMGVGLIVGVWVARYLGPEQFGLFNFAAAFVGMFGAVAGLGLQGIVVRDLVREPSSKAEILGSAAALQLVSGFVAYGLILVTIFWLRPDDALAKTIVAILGSTMLFKASEVAVCWFESQVLSKFTVWVQNGTFFVFATVKAALILQGAPLVAFAWVTMAEGLAVALIMLIVLSVGGPQARRLRVTRVRIKALLKESWPLLLSGVSVVIYMKIDQIMLGQMIGDGSVGIYSVAARLSEIWYIIPVIVVSSVFPSLARQHEKSSEVFLKNLQKLYEFLIKSAFIACVFVTFFSEEIINFVFGNAYQDSAIVLSFHVWSGIFVFFGTAWSKWIILEGLQSVALKMHLLSLVSNICLNFVLIPLYGAVGAAVATTISYALGHTLFMLIFPSQKTAVKMFWKSFSLNNFL